MKDPRYTLGSIINVGKVSERILDKIYDTLVKMEQRLKSIETHLKKYESKDEDKRQLLND